MHSYFLLFLDDGANAIVQTDGHNNLGIKGDPFLISLKIFGCMMNVYLLPDIFILF